VEEVKDKVSYGAIVLCGVVDSDVCFCDFNCISLFLSVKCTRPEPAKDPKLVLCVVLILAIACAAVQASIPDDEWWWKFSMAIITTLIGAYFPDWVAFFFKRIFQRDEIIMPAENLAAGGDLNGDDMSESDITELLDEEGNN